MDISKLTGSPALAGWLVGWLAGWLLTGDNIWRDRAGHRAGSHIMQILLSAHRPRADYERMGGKHEPKNRRKKPQVGEEELSVGKEAVG